ncbi:MAG: hypothetical protein RLW87_20410 [Alphaproteobacteria bacterium]
MTANWIPKIVLDRGGRIALCLASAALAALFLVGVIKAVELLFLAAGQIPFAYAETGLMVLSFYIPVGILALLILAVPLFFAGRLLTAGLQELRVLFRKGAAK